MIRFAYLACLSFSLLFTGLPLTTAGGTGMSKLVALDFEVFGIVQGVFFRKYTQKRGQELGLTGWCRNTPDGTVAGHLQGEKRQVEEMKHWLRHTGSPQSRIDKAEFRNEKEISELSLSKFEIRK
ncbi:acylphosphatase-1-like [Odontomachus brunneus]|uniref:acylphosphatase-1-like n=1 Tax=Odontomachus brunneus TaxID=486640 RepID=UPI0013F1912A|nr:acylphosphatase-1-like [Odontomachus brunneus]